MDENNKTFNVEGSSEPAKPNEVASPVEPEKHVADIKQEEVKPPHKKFSFNKSKLVKGIAGALLLGSTVSSCVLLGKVYSTPEAVTKEEFNDLMTRIGDIETSIAAHSAEISKMKIRMEEMQEDIKLDKEIIEALKSGVEETQRAIATLEAELAAKVAELEKAMLEGDTKVKEELKADIADKQAQIDVLKVSDEKMQAQIGAMETAFNAKIADALAAIEKEAQARAASIKDVNDLIAQTNKNVEQNAQNIKSANTEIKALQESISNLTKKVEDDIGKVNQQMAKDKAELQTEIKNLSESLEALQKQLQDLVKRVDKNDADIEANVKAIEELKKLIAELKALLDMQEQSLEEIRRTKQSIISLSEDKIVLLNNSTVDFAGDYEDLYKDKYVEILSELNPSQTSLIRSTMYFPSTNSYDGLKPLQGSITKLNQGVLELRIYNTKSINIYYASGLESITPIEIIPTPTGSYTTLSMIANTSYETTFNFINGDLTINVKGFSKISTVNAAVYSGHGTISFEGGSTVTKGVKGSKIKGSVTPDQDCKLYRVEVKYDSVDGELIRNAIVNYNRDTGTFEVELPSITEDRTIYVVATIQRTYKVSIETVTGGSIEFDYLPTDIFESASLPLTVSPDDGMICSKLLCTVNGGEQKDVTIHKPGVINYNLVLTNLPDQETYPAGAMLKFIPVFEAKGIMTFNEFSSSQYTRDININGNSKTRRTPDGGFVKGEQITIRFTANTGYRAPNDQTEFNSYITIKDQFNVDITATYGKSSAGVGSFTFTCPEGDNAAITINLTLPTN